MGEFWIQPREKAFWDEIDFLKLAESSQLVNQFRSSIYFIEVWSNKKM